MSQIQAARFERMDAAADFLGNGAIEINKYESEIYDIIRRNSIFLQRVDVRPANGHPHRYFEQTAIATATFTDPRNIVPTPTGPTRLERAAMIKAITNQTNLSLFDVDVTRQQGQFAYVESKDIEDIITSVIVLEASNVWNGNDTSLVVPTTIQYVGLLTQITQQATIAPGASIIDGLKAQVAVMAANVNYVVKPTAIYINPILGDYVDREAKASQITFDKTEVVAGVKVNSIQTQVGMLPIITEPFIPITPAAGTAFGFAALPAGQRGFYAVIVTEKDIEMPVIHGGDGNLQPRLFQLGLLAGLQGQYVAIHFNSIIAKGNAAGISYPHAVVQVARP